eukprot:m51a1_g1696 putative wd repeat-containing protein 61 (309) ;mRNA; r:481262-482613
MVFETVKRVEKAHDEGIWSVDWRGDRIATGSLCSRARVKTWRAGTFEQESVIESDHQLAVVSVSLSAAGSSLATSSLDSLLQVWDLRDGKRENKRTIQTEPAEAWSAKLSPDGTRVAVTGQGGCVSVYPVDDARDARAKSLELQTGAKFGSSLAWSSDGARLACGAMDGLVALFDVANARRLHALVGVHLMPVRSVSFSPEGDRLLAASDDTLVSMCDVEYGKTISTFSGHSSWVLAVRHSPAAGSKLFATGSSDKTVRIWDVGQKTPAYTFSEHKDQVWGVAFNDDGTQLASVSDDASLIVYNTVAQ